MARAHVNSDQEVMFYSTILFDEDISFMVVDESRENLDRFLHYHGYTVLDYLDHISESFLDTLIALNLEGIISVIHIDGDIIRLYDASEKLDDRVWKVLDIVETIKSMLEAIK